MQDIIYRSDKATLRYIESSDGPVWAVRNEEKGYETYFSKKTMSVFHSPFEKAKEHYIKIGGVI